MFVYICVNYNCSVYQTASIVGKKWTLLILLELYKGKTPWKRFKTLKNSLMEITPKILSERLKELEIEGLITKKIDTSSFPIKTYYRLSEKGEDFIEIIEQMKRWSLKWKSTNRICSSQSCKDCPL